MAPTSRYIAFISYSHADEKVASWLHKSIETYSVPKRLIGQPSPLGPIPARLKPLFRDRDELASSADLSSSIKQALEDSAFLIVICSPNAVKSKWVNEEILAFQRMGKSDRILALIVEGEPTESFPDALKSAEPIAADLRPTGDGKRSALLKILAGLLGVGFDDLRQRDLHRRQRRMAVALAVSFVITAITTGLGVIAVLKSREAVRERQRAEENFRKSEENFKKSEENFKQARQAVQSFFTELGKSEFDRVPGVVNLRIVLLNEAVDYYRKFLADRPDDEPLQHELQSILFVLADQYRRAGATAKARISLDEAVELAEKSGSRDPSDLRYLNGQFMTYSLEAKMLVQEGKLMEAGTMIAKQIDVLKRQLEGDPKNEVAQRRLAFSYSELAAQYANEGKTAEAGVTLAQALDMLERIYAMNPLSGADARVLAVAYSQESRHLDQEGRVEAAVESGKKAVETMESLAATETADVANLRVLATSYGSLAGLFDRSGKFADARLLREKMVTAWEQVVEKDPGNAESLFLLAVAYGQLAIGLEHEGGDASRDVRTINRKALTILERRVASDPRNVAILTTLAGAYGTQASLCLREGETAEALAANAKAVETCERIVEADPGNPRALRNMAIMYGERADFFLKTGYAAEATETLRKAAALLEGLVNKDPGNEENARYLSIAYGKQAQQYASIGMTNEANTMVQKAAAIWKQLNAAHPDDPRILRHTAISYDHQASQELAAGHGQAAWEVSEKARTIKEELVKQNPKNIGNLKLLSITYAKQAQILLQIGRTNDALEMISKAIQMQQQLVDSDTDNAALLQTLAMSTSTQAGLLETAGRLDDALVSNQKAVELQERLVQQDAGNTDAARLLASNYAMQSNLLRALGRLAEARSLLEKSLSNFDQLVQRMPGDIRSRNHQARAYGVMADLLEAEGRPNEANEFREKALAGGPVAAEETATAPAESGGNALSAADDEEGASVADATEAFPISELEDIDASQTKVLMGAIGKMVSVRGTVETFGTYRNGSVAVIIFRDVDRNRGLSVHMGDVLIDKLAEKFGEKPASYLVGKGVRIRGIVAAPEGAPRILMRWPGQIEVLDDATTAAYALRDRTEIVPEFAATNITELLARVGQRVKISGTVVRIHCTSNGTGFVNFKGMPLGALGVRIPADRYDALDKSFAGGIVSALQDKVVTLTGTVIMYNKRPDISISMREQILVADGQASTPPATVPEVAPAPSSPAYRADDTQTLLALVGKKIIVRGVVNRVETTRNGKSLRVVFDGALETGLSAMIFESKRDLVNAAFDGDIAKAIEGRMVEIEGTLETFRDAPQIVINQPKQIHVVP